nr:restriction endonuclease [Qipengyuania xiapuensis]
MGGSEGDRILINHPAKLRAQQTVGVIADGGMALEILPKIEGAEADNAARKSLIHMLCGVLDLEIADGAVTDLGWQKDDLLEILIRLFCDRLFGAVHRGLPRRYIEHRDDLPALRGRLDAIRQFSTLAANPSRLACHFDELSADIALNQIMKAAVVRLGKIAKAQENKRRLSELQLAFADVSDVPVSALRWDRVVIDRTNRSWAQLLSLAKLLLGERFQTTSLGRARGFSLLFEMNKLFEEFVGRALQRSLRGTPLGVRLQGPRSYVLQEKREDGSDAFRFATKPDITLSDSSGHRLIIDTKWKRLKGAIDDPKQGVSQQDIYQMMAYSHVYQCTDLLLLYPHHKGLQAEEGLIAEHRVCGTESTRILIGSIALDDPRSAPDKLSALLEMVGLRDGEMEKAA